MKLFGLIGNPLTHSYSKDYFTSKFRKENIKNCRYKLFPIENLQELHPLISRYPELLGLNVTIPYKKNVLPLLHKAGNIPLETGAVNCIKIDRTSDRILLTGYNTDVYGFTKSLEPLLKSRHDKALILGTGGSAGSVAYGLKQFGINAVFVSRSPKQNDHIGYHEISRELLRQHLLIINTTPAGMFPETEYFPDLPYQWISRNHLLFDLIYNPAETLFLKKGKAMGAMTKNGLEMLYLQAEKSWEIWNQ